MTQVTQPLDIGFIGLGIMGRSMAGHLLAAGHRLHVFNRTASKAAPLTDKGARLHDAPGSVAAASDIVITMVGYPKDVEDIYLGADGLLARARPGSLMIDMTTSSPSLAIRLAKTGADHGIQVLDAPVSGGDVGAKEARLAIMVGGDAAAFARAEPVFALMGKNINHLGGPGAGQHAKMANQIVIASTITGVCEGLAYARAAGLDAHKVVQAIGSGAAGSFQLNVLGPRMLNGDFGPGFYVHHFMKDLAIAIEEADRNGIALPGLTQARRLFQLLAESGGRELGTQGLFRLYSDGGPKLPA